MAGLPPGASEDDRKISGAYRSLIAVAFSELSRDLRHLAEGGWEEPVRRRALELASTLADACERQGLEALAGHARAAANLARLSKADVAPILPALRSKFDALNREIEKSLSRASKHSSG